jgi:hypothetical protein
MRIIIASSVIQNGKNVSAILYDGGARQFPLKYQWFYDGIYRGGFGDINEAIRWGKKDGALPEDYSL